jgi:hypothetical protein
MDLIPQISEDIKAVRKTTDATLDEIKGISDLTVNQLRENRV